MHVTHNLASDWPKLLYNKKAVLITLKLFIFDKRK